MMNDERSQAIADMRRMKAEYMNGKEMNEVTERKCRSFDTAIKAIEQTTWIPVSERLPEENKTVIASTKYGVFPETKYTKEYGWEWAYEAGADYWMELKSVTAWMPLPEPYKGE